MRAKNDEMMKYDNAWYERVKEAATKAGLQLGELADTVGIHRGYLGKCRHNGSIRKDVVEDINKLLFSEKRTDESLTFGYGGKVLAVPHDREPLIKPEKQSNSWEGKPFAERMKTFVKVEELPEFEDEDNDDDEEPVAPRRSVKSDDHILMWDDFKRYITSLFWEGESSVSVHDIAHKITEIEKDYA